MYFKRLIGLLFCFTTVIHADAQSQYTNYWKATTLLQQKKLDSALLIAKQAIIDLPQKHEPLLLCGKILSAQKDTVTAMIYYEKANAMERGVAWLPLAQIAMAQHNDSMAITCLQALQASEHRLPFSALNKIPDFTALHTTTAWERLTDITAEQRFIDRCEQLLQKKDFLQLDWAADSAIKQNEWASAHWYKACAWKGFDNTKIEHRELLVAIQLSEKSGTYYAALARNYAQQNNLKQAIETTTKAINLLPDSVGLVYYRATLMLQNKQYSAALSDVLQLIAIFPANDSLWYMAGSIESEQKHTLAALPYLNRAIELNASHGEYFKCRGNTLFDSESYELAERNFSMALDVSPTDGTLYFNRGLCRIKLHETQKACYDFKHAAQLHVYAAQEYMYRTCEK